jgi:hypothetical protein
VSNSKTLIENRNSWKKNVEDRRKEWYRNVEGIKEWKQLEKNKEVDWEALKTGWCVDHVGIIQKVVPVMCFKVRDLRVSNTFL